MWFFVFYIFSVNLSFSPLFSGFWWFLLVLRFSPFLSKYQIINVLKYLQDSVLGEILYFGDRRECDQIPTYSPADHTAFVGIENTLQKLGTILQDQLNETCKWTKKWGITVNVQKSAHLTFALKKKVNHRC